MYELAHVANTMGTQIAAQVIANEIEKLGK